MVYVGLDGSIGGACITLDILTDFLLSLAAERGVLSSSEAVARCGGG